LGVKKRAFFLRGLSFLYLGDAILFTISPPSKEAYLRDALVRYTKASPEDKDAQTTISLVTTKPHLSEPEQALLKPEPELDPLSNLASEQPGCSSQVVGTRNFLDSLKKVCKNIARFFIYEDDAFEGIVFKGDPKCPPIALPFPTEETSFSTPASTPVSSVTGENLRGSPSGNNNESVVDTTKDVTKDEPRDKGSVSREIEFVSLDRDRNRDREDEVGGCCRFQ